MIRSSHVRITGPLAPFAQDFFDHLLAQGYRPLVAEKHVRVLAQVSGWLEAHHFKPSEFTAPRIEQFLRAQPKPKRRRWIIFEKMLEYLRGMEVLPHIPHPKPVTELDRLLARYRDHLILERGLTARTVHNRTEVARRFLGPHSSTMELRAADVTRFVVLTCRSANSGYAQHITTALRSLLRFLFLEGLTPTRLDAAVPTVAGWSQASLPRRLEPDEIARLLRGCDRRTSLGRRNYAMIVLLLRLGLRAGEVAAIRLDDIDWRRGEILIRGKGAKDERLPLPFDVGEAVVAYLRAGRPRVACRSLFLTSRAPVRGVSSDTVSYAVASAGRRAGLTVRAHCLRHTAASEMLRRGASLPEVAQVLRHSRLKTTAIYAKVDRVALRELARPWPGGGEA